MIAALLRLGAALTLLLTAAAAAAQEPPQPAQTQRLALATDDNYAALVYTALEPVKDGKPRAQTYVELHQRRGDAWTLRNKLRLPDSVSKDFQFKLVSSSLGKGRRVLRFEAAPPSSREAEEDQFQAWFDASGDHPVIWSGSLDALEPSQRVELQDLDGDGALEILQAQRDAGVFFCGQSEALLSPRVWSFRNQRFEDAPQKVQLQIDAPRLEAVLDAEAPPRSHFPGLAAFQAASSDLRDSVSGLRSRVSQPTALGDGDYNSVWIEGVDGAGRGEFVTARVNPAWPLRGLRITPGAVANEKVWGTYGRPSLLLLSFADGTRYQVALPRAEREPLRERGGLYVALPAPLQTHCLTVAILEVEQPPAGRRLAQTAISEISPLIDLDYASRQTAVEQLIDQMSRERDHQRRVHMQRLASGLGPELGEAVLANLRRELATEGGRPRLDLLLPMMSAVSTAQGDTILVELLSWDKLSGDELSALQRTITLRGQRYLEVLARVALDEAAAPLLRTRALEIFSRAAPPERVSALLPLLGQGEPQMRRAVVRGLSRAPLSDSPALLAAAASQADSPASHDALWALDRVFRYHLHGEPRQLPGAENILRAYNETEDLQIRLRAVTLLRRVKVTNGDAFLIAVLESRERPEVRERAAEALLLYGEEKVTEALLRALQDESPPVRFAALKALEGREGQPRVVDALTQYARKEGWRRGQRRVYRLLALSEQRQGADLLYERIEGSDDAQALLALSALNSGRNNIRALPLERVIRAEGRAVRVRAQATRALTWGSDPTSERLLVELVTGRLGAPPEVRVSAARALGSRRTRLGQEALVEAVRDPTDPNLQRACLRSLGRYNSPAVRELLIGLRSEVSLRVRPALEEAINATQLP